MASLSLSQLSWKGQIAAFAGLALLAAGAFYYVIETPAQQRLTAQQTELDSLRQRINKALGTARQLEQFKQDVAQMRVQLESLKPILPEEKDAADLLRRVNTLAVQSNLTIRGFRPQPITTRQLHAEWPITLELEGTYHNLGTFLDRVSKFPRIINIGNLAIGARQQQAPNATIEVTCTATTFVLLDTPAAAAPAKKAAAAPTKTE